MDNRKLVYAGHTAITNFDGLVEEVAELRDGASLTIAYVVNPNADLELIRRWNSFPALVEALESIESLSVDDNGDRIVPAGFLDEARALLATLEP